MLLLLQFLLLCLPRFLTYINSFITLTLSRKTYLWCKTSPLDGIRFHAAKKYLMNVYQTWSSLQICIIMQMWGKNPVYEDAIIKSINMFSRSSTCLNHMQTFFFFIREQYAKLSKTLSRYLGFSESVTASASKKALTDSQRTNGTTLSNHHWHLLNFLQ